MSDTNSTTGGLSHERLQHLKATIEADIAQGRYRGAAIIVARHGEVGLCETLGECRADDRRPVAQDSVFSLFSLTKALTNVLVFRAIELGLLSFHTKVSSVIPEFSGKPREDLTIYHLMTHSTGLPGVFTPVPGMCIDKLDEIIAAICKYVHAVEEPGQRVNYSPMAAHALLGEMLRRTDPAGRSFRQLIDDELFKPLRMNDTSVGVRKDLQPRHIVPEFPPTFPATHPGHSNLGPNGAFEEEHAEMPWVGVVSTIGDMFRFGEMLRNGGELDGVRILSPTMLDYVTQLHTGDKPNELYKALALGRGWQPYPAYIGIGFSLRGDAICQHQFGTLTSPRTFGNHGAGSTVLWVDPELDMTFVCLTTALMDEGDNIERFQRLADIAVSAAIPKLTAARFHSTTQFRQLHQEIILP